MPKARPSTRATSKVTLQVGLLSIPVSLFSAITDESKVKRNEFVRVEVDGETTLHSVGRGSIDKETGELLDPDTEVVRLVNTEYGPVSVTDEEVETLLNLDTKSINVLAFQPLAMFYQGHYVPKGLMHVEPTKVKVKSKNVVPEGILRAFTALLKGMRAEGVMAVVEYTDRGVPKPAILLPNAELWLLHNTDAVREQRELPVIEVSDANVATIRALIQPLRSTEVLDLDDKRSALINAFANEKASEGEFDSPQSSVVAEPVVEETDLLAALAASIQSAKEASA